MAALDGVRVLDASGELGGYAAQLLTELGADVIVAESETGAVARHRPPLLLPGTDGGRACDGVSLAYLHQRAGQRIATLTDDAGSRVATLRRLSADADVVLVGPEWLTATPTDDAATGIAPVLEARPAWAPAGAIVCLLTHFGQGGPRDDWRSTEFVSYAVSGQMWAVGSPEGPPLAIPGRAVYSEFGSHAAALVIQALRERDVKGGQDIYLALHDLLVYRGAQAMSVYHQSKKEFATRHVTPDAPPAGIWQVKDGAVEVAVYQPPQWRSFFAMMGSPAELAGDDFANRGVRLERAEEISALVREFMSGWTVADFIAAAHQYKVPCAPLRDPADLVNDAQLQDRNFFVTRTAPSGHTYVAPGAPFVTAPALWRADPAAPVADLDPAAPLWRDTRRNPVAGTKSMECIRVVSFGTAIAGNLTATMLAELGADVVKVESPKMPDPMRNGPIHPDIPRVFGPDGIETNIRFASYTRSCRSIGLDMRADDDKELFLQLLAQTDVLIDNFAGGTFEKWGLDRAELLERFPDLVIATISGYGRTGPMQDYRAYGANINAYTGLTREWFEHTTQCDWTAVSHALVGVMAALAERDRTGRGTYIDLAQTEATCASIASMILGPINGRPHPWLQPNVVPGSVLSVVLPCAGDDEWLAVELETDGDAHTLRRFLGLPDGSVDTGEVAALREALAVFAAPRAAAHAAAELQRVGLAAAPVARVGDVYQDGQLWARGAMVHVVHPDIGDALYLAPFQRLSGQRTVVKWPSPRLGEHRDEIIAQWGVAAGRRRG